MLDIARGDAARSHQLRASLKILRDRTTDPAFRTLVDDVLAGKRGLRDAVRSPVFDQAISPQVQQAVDKLNEMSDEEKQQLAEEGERQLERLRESMRAPKSTPPQDDDDGSEDSTFWKPSW
jgi:hypothetical protein